MKRLHLALTRIIMAPAHLCMWLLFSGVLKKKKRSRSNAPYLLDRTNQTCHISYSPRAAHHSRSHASIGKNEKSATRSVPVTRTRDKSCQMLNVTTFDSPGCNCIKKTFACQRTWTLTTSHVGNLKPPYRKGTEYGG
jgi:hypothetical protein